MPQKTFVDVAIAEIKAEMARQNMSQARLGERLGWGQWSVSKRLTGKVPLRLAELEQIAEALGVSITQLGAPLELVRRAS